MIFSDLLLPAYSDEFAQDFHLFPFSPARTFVCLIRLLHIIRPTPAVCHSFLFFSCQRYHMSGKNAISRACLKMLSSRYVPRSRVCLKNLSCNLAKILFLDRFFCLILFKGMKYFLFIFSLDNQYHLLS